MSIPTLESVGIATPVKLFGPRQLTLRRCNDYLATDFYRYCVFLANCKSAAAPLNAEVGF